MADRIRGEKYEGAVLVMGSIFALGVLATLGFLVLRSTSLPCNNRPLFVAFFALGCACASWLLGGYAAYRGNIGNASAVSLGGGVAVLVTVLLLGNRIWSDGCKDATAVNVTWGSISGLTPADDVWPDRVSDFDTYKRIINEKDNTRRFEWIIRFPSGRTPVRFVFQHLAPKPKSDPLQYPEPKAEGVESSNDLVPHNQRFRLPSGDSPIVLDYALPKEAGSPGTLYYNNEKGTVPVQWFGSAASDTPVAAITPKVLERAFPLLFPVSVYAGEQNICSADNKLSPQQRDYFLDDLASPRLAVQIAARAQLVRGREHCINLIRAASKDPGSERRQKGVLVASLTSAVDELLEAKVSAPGELLADVAVAQYQLHQFDRASKYFGRVDANTFARDPNLVFFKAYTQLKLGKPEEALQLYNAYEAAAPAEAQRSGAYHANVGMALYEIGKAEDKRGDVKAARARYQESTRELQKAV